MVTKINFDSSKEQETQRVTVQNGKVVPVKSTIPVKRAVLRQKE